MPNIEKRGNKSFRLTVEVGTPGKRKVERKTIRVEDSNLLKKLRN